jgi:hypothetical protein
MTIYIAGMTADFLFHFFELSTNGCFYSWMKPLLTSHTSQLGTAAPLQTISTFVGNARCVHLCMRSVSNKEAFICKQPVRILQRQDYIFIPGHKLCLFWQHIRFLLRLMLSLFSSVQPYPRLKSSTLKHERYWITFLEFKVQTQFSISQRTLLYNGGNAVA